MLIADEFPSDQLEVQSDTHLRDVEHKSGQSAIGFLNLLFLFNAEHRLLSLLVCCFDIFLEIVKS